VAVLTQRTALIVNPASRAGARAEVAVLRAFHEAGASPTVERTRSPGDGIRVARELAAAHDRLFVLGGDGTVMEAATGLAELGADLPIGILPAGTGNQLARALSIPLSPSRAVATLVGAEGRRIDAAVLNGHRRVGIGAGFGLDAAMIAGAHGRLKRTLGAASYVVSATASALSPVRFPLHAVVDGQVIERMASVAMVLNLGSLFDGLLEVAPGASLTDGLLDLVVVDTHDLLDALTFSVTEILFRRRHADPRWTFARGREISIRTDQPGVRAQVDGDLIESRQLTLQIAPRALHLLLPAGARLT
jgi:diacylglycerol kinase (ATP)